LLTFKHYQRDTASTVCCIDGAASDSERKEKFAQENIIPGSPDPVYSGYIIYATKEKASVLLAFSI
jgi:hypothetical protein